MTDLRINLFRIAASAVYLYSRLPRARGAWRLKELVKTFAPPQPVHCEVNRGGMRFDLTLEQGRDIDWALLFWGRHEPTSSDWVRRTVREGWTCLDVGANIGYFTIMLGQLVGVRGRVLAFEPCGEFRERLATNLRLNRLSNVQVEDLGLSNRDSVTSILVDGCTASIEPAHWSPGAARGSAEIRLVDLDTWWRKSGLDRLDFIKVDTDGHEAKFLQGARETIARYRPIMMIEVCPEVLLRGRDEALELLGELGQLGYDIWSEDGRTRFATPGEALDCFLVGDAAGANAVCIPR